jgi:F-type H+-transporting ATPase subunit b
MQEGEMEKQRIIESANRQAAYITEQAKLAVQQEIKAAKGELQEEIANLSVAAAEDILKKNMKSDDHKRLVQEFLTKAVEAK